MKQKYTILLAITFGIWLILGSCKSEGSESTVNAPGVTDTEIRLGSFGPLTGPAALWGSIIKGTDAYFRMINEEGGINGRQIKFYYKDDEFNPSKTVPAVRELIQQDEVFAIAGGIGTATSMSVFGFLEENKVPWFTPMTGAVQWTQPPKENIYSIFPLYVDEGQIMAEFAVNQLEAKKLGVIYVNDDFGKSGLAGVRYKLKQLGMDLVAELPVEPADTDLSSHIARLKESGAEAVFLWVTPRHGAIALGTSAVVDFKPHWLSSLVLSDMSLMHNITKGAWEGVYFTSFVEMLPGNPKNEDFKKYREAYQKYYPQERWGSFPALGMVMMEPMVEGLRRAGKDLTRQSFLDAVAGMNDFVATGGIPVSFSKENHLGLRSLCILKCKSATEAEVMTDMIKSSGNVDEIMNSLKW